MMAWLLGNALVAAALALLALAVIRCFRPAPAVRHTLWLIVLLKLVSPGGWFISVPLPVTTPMVSPEQATTEVQATEDAPHVEDVLVVCVAGPATEESDLHGGDFEQQVVWMEHIETYSPPMTQLVELPTPPPFTPVAAADALPPEWLVWGVWLIGALLVGWRQCRDTRRFALFVRRSHVAPDALVSEVAIVANQMRVRVPHVRVLPGLASPVMWCLWAPVLLWPAGLEQRLKGAGRRAVIAHELAHLRRRDHWVRRLEMLVAVLHWWNPLFWLTRKRLRADAEFACDAWATGLADRRAYAEALLEVCSFQPRHRPAPAVGVVGEGRRTMQERLTMIMQDGQPGRLHNAVKLLVALMFVAAVPAWTLGQGASTKTDDKKDDKKEIKKDDKKEIKKDDPEAQAIEKQIQQLQEKLKAVRAARDADTAAVKKIQELKLKMVTPEEKKDIELKLLSTKDGVKVIGADGKEVKDIRVIVVDPAKGQQPQVTVVKSATVAEPVKVIGVAPKTVEGTKMLTARVVGASEGVALTRATYKLTKEQVSAVATLLGAIKGTVMETKVDGDSITITTTPEAQAAIGTLLRMVKGQPAQGAFLFSPGPANTATITHTFVPAVPGQATTITGTFAPVAPTAPATVKPTVPTPPAPPAPPVAPKAPAVKNIPAAPAPGATRFLELKDLDAEKLAEQLRLFIEAKAKGAAGEKEKATTEKK